MPSTRLVVALLELGATGGIVVLPRRRVVPGCCIGWARLARLHRLARLALAGPGCSGWLGGYGGFSLILRS